MVHRFFRRLWIELLIAFDENFTLEGFERTQEKFELPENLSLLDPSMKRKLTICNLFANQNQSIKNIARVLEVNLSNVVAALIENGLIKERRSRTKRIKQEKRQKSEVSLERWRKSVLSKPGGRDIAIAMARGAMRIEASASEGTITDLPLSQKAKSA